MFPMSISKPVVGPGNYMSSRYEKFCHFIKSVVINMMFIQGKTKTLEKIKIIK